jgi:hypothetical protein
MQITKWIFNVDQVKKADRNQQGNWITGKEETLVDSLGGDVASSISSELYGVRISPIREGVGVR